MSCEARAIQRIDAPVAVQDAAGDRPDPRQGRERGARAAQVLEEARGEADREDAAARRSRTPSRRRARTNESLDVDALYVKHAIVNEGPKLKRFMPAAQGRATPIQKRTSHVEIVVGRRRRGR